MKKVLLMTVLCIMSTALFAQNVSDFEIQGNDDGTMAILTYKGVAKDIVIPETIFNMPVTRLRAGAFRQKGITNVVIPSGVTFIGANTFSDNQLTSVTIPDSIEYIGDSAFASNKLTTVTIPEKVTTIGNSAFYRNQLTSITIPDSVVYIGASAFSGNKLTTVVIGNGTVYIGRSAFSENTITDVTLGNAVRNIEEYTFYNHRIKTLVIPESVVYIGGQAFAPYGNNTLTSITLGKYVMFGVAGHYDYDTAYGPFYNNANFNTLYEDTDKLAGTYTLASDGTWETPTGAILQPRPDQGIDRGGGR